MTSNNNIILFMKRSIQKLTRNKMLAYKKQFDINSINEQILEVQTLLYFTIIYIYQ